MIELDHDVFKRLMNVFSIIMLFGWSLPTAFFGIWWDLHKRKLGFICGVLTTIMYLYVFIFRTYAYVLYGV